MTRNVCLATVSDWHRYLDQKVFVKSSIGSIHILVICNMPGMRQPCGHFYEDDQQNPHLLKVKTLKIYRIDK